MQLLIQKLWSFQIPILGQACHLSPPQIDRSAREAPSNFTQCLFGHCKRQRGGVNGASLPELVVQLLDTQIVQRQPKYSGNFCYFQIYQSFETKSNLDPGAPLPYFHSAHATVHCSVTRVIQGCYYRAIRIESSSQKSCNLRNKQAKASFARIK